MKVLLILLLAVFYTVQAISPRQFVLEEWESFKSQFNKEYESSEEERYRLNVFMENSLEIAKHNEMYGRNEVTYELGLNEYSDMTHEEFDSQMNGLNISITDVYEDTFDAATFIAPANVELPNTVDWRSQGAVTPVKNQGNFFNRTKYVEFH